MDKGKSCAALLTDLSKTFGWIVHNFLIVKLDFIDLLLDVPQGSILHPFLFIIYICDLFFFVVGDNVTSYADDTSPYLNGKNVVTVLDNIETKGKEVLNWFYINYLKTNPSESKLLLT